MLRRVNKAAAATGDGQTFAIVASRYNPRYVDGLLNAAVRELKKSGGKPRVIRVPGAFEIPVVAARLAALSRRPAAIICLGVILRGETTHAQHIGEAVSQALMQIQITQQLPVIHEVLLLENRQQAEARCLDPQRNRGVEAARTAMEMARVLAEL